MNRRRCLLLIACMSTGPLAVRAAAPAMLLETDWLAAHCRDADVRVVDLRSSADFEVAHVPGAVNLDEAALRNREDAETYLPKPEVFEALMSKLGIRQQTHVVAYDAQAGRSAARFWYVMSAYGHDRVSVVNGGWPKWSAEKRDGQAGAAQVEPTSYRARLSPSLTCPSTEVLKQKGALFLDTRSPEEYAGTTTSPGSKAQGRIPGSINVDWRENVSGPYQTFKPAEELRKLYADKGATPDREIVTYCASGGRASHTLFTLKMLGYKKVRVYYGSFADYTSRPGVPLEKP